MKAFTWLMAIALAGAPAGAQVRDTTKTPVGTGSIAGVVMSAESPDTPLRKVSVMLGAGEQLRAPTSTVTDDAGRFSFSGLPAGAYTLIATRAGYVTSTYGAKVPGRAQGVPISVADGQQVTGIAMTLMHGAAITGTVRYPSGRPAADIGVGILEAKMNGQRRLSPVFVPVTTDDRGVYRAFGLAPGTYLVRVELGQANRAGADTTGMRQITPEELAWAEQMQRGAAGAPAGAPTAASPAPPPPAQPVAYTAVYYPGVLDASAAGQVTVRAGEERANVDVMVALVPTATLRGQVLDPAGQPAPGAQVRLVSTASTGDGLSDLMTSMMGLGGARAANGEFTLPNVAPGRYRLVARGRPPAPPGAAPARPGAADSGFSFMGMLGGNNTMSLWASEEIDVNGRDLEGLVLRLQPGLDVSGKVVFETSKPTPPDPSRARIGFSAVDASGGGSPIAAVGKLMTGTFANAQKDGTFTVSGLAPDTYRTIYVPPNMMMPPPLMPVPPGGFVLKSAVIDGRDIADEPLTLQAGREIKDLVVTFTDVLNEIGGTVQDATGQPVGGYPIVVFSTNRAHWTFGSRRIMQARPSSDGKYKVQGLPAGEYYLCALTDLDPNDLYDPDFLEQLVGGSLKMSLADGEKKVQDLKLGGGSR